ncbi:ESPR-type extended signal peptide-containing protein [Paraburkholderia hospita]|uniref:ESPR-type extended signal peptide-containing protein n=1 Tax=Paraburkholderia hospita TaxID=169430 RepID=UPI000F09BF32|nr:ESPR-type extended signal peptide-containing protein [Paraburkholderia hospita]
MNKTYRSVWNESTGTWVAAQENAKGRGKKSSSGTGAAIATGKFALAAVVAPLCVGFGAFTPDFAMASGICVTNSDGTKAYDSRGGAQSGSNFATGCPAIASETIWLDGTNPNTTNALQLYAANTQIDMNSANKTILFSPDGTSKLWMKASGSNVLLNGVAAGAISASSTDAVNGSQLFNAINTLSGVKYFHANSTQTDSAASGSESIAVGVAAVSSGASSIAQGVMASASGDNSIALGTGASAKGSKSVAVGAGSVANSSTLGSAGFNAGSTPLSAGTASGELSIGGAGAERRITNVAAGYSATDAVNVSQLMSESAKVNQMGANTAALLGGSASFNSSTGAITNPTYVVADGTFNTVGAALTAIDKSKGADNPLAVAYDDASKNQITLQGAGGATKIANVAAGTAPADAVNVSQLSGVTQALGGGASVKADGSIAQPTYNVYGNTYSNVGDALGNISSATGNIVESLKYIKFGPSAAATAQVSGNDSIALGGNSYATQNGAVAIGTGAKAQALNAVAIGYGSVATAVNTFAVGSIGGERRIVNVANGISDSDAATVGQMNEMGSDLQTQIANLNKSPTILKSSALLGATSDSDPATVAQVRSMTNALGGGAAVAADGSVTAPGYVLRGQTYSNVGDAFTTVAKTTDKISFGPTSEQNANFAYGSGTNSVAVGPNAIASMNGSVALGTLAWATASNSVALGYGSMASAANTVSIGTVFNQRRIVNVADGINDTDAATVGQVNSDIQAAIANLNTTNNSGLLKSAVRSGSLLAGQNTSSLTPDQVIFVGPTDLANTISAQGTNAIAIGLATAADGDNSVAIGNNARVGAANAVGIGQNTIANGVGSAALGSQVSTQGTNSVAIGVNGTQANGDHTVAIGENAVTSLGSLNSVAIGQNVVSTGTGSVVLGYASVDGGQSNVVSVGNNKLQRRITNVAAGTQSTDAVNVSQLTGVTAALGGGATVNADGSIKKPTYSVQGTTATDVGTAIAKLDGTVSNVSNNVTNLTQNFNNIVNGGGIKYFHASSTLADSSASGAESVAIGGGAIASGANSVALGSGSVASSGSLGVKGFAPDNAALTAGTAFGELSIGTSGKERRITNVAAGYNATDAVNVSQLMAEDVKVNNVSNNLSNLSNVVNNIGANVSMKYFHTNSSLVDSTASGANAIAVGPQATAAGTNAIAVGYNASATSAESVALGSNSTTSANLSATAYNPGNATLSGTTAAGEVSVGNGSFNRRITNVAAGYAGTDAVNVSQLMAEDVKVNNLSNTVNNIANGGANMKYFNVSSSLAAASANGTDSVAAGPGAVVLSTASGAVALGANSVADRANTVSVGSAGTQRQIVNVAAGTANTDAANVSQLSGVTKALGGGASVKADGSIAQPTYNVYGNTYSNVGDALANISSSTNNIVQSLKYIKFGPSTAAAAQASNTDAIGIGGNAYATANGALAIGAGSKAQALNSVAIGYGSIASVANTFAVSSIGAERRIVNVANGINDTDAATVGQVNSDIQAAIAKLNLNTTNNSGLLKSAVRSAGLQAFENTSSLTPDQVIFVGPTDLANTISAQGTDSIAIGLATAADGNNSVAIGNNARVGAENAVGIGQNAIANGVGSAAMGSQVSTQGTNSVAMGVNGTQANGDDSVAIGSNAVTSLGAANSVAIGQNVVSTGTSSVVLGYASVDGGQSNVVSVGNSKQQRRIINIAAGTQNNDAVNVSQLSGVASALGGGASVNPTTGAVVAPAYTLAGNTYVNVAAALTSLDTRIASGGDPLAVDYDSSTKDVISLKGSTGTKITGLTAGALSASSTEAINGSQLYAQGTSMAKALGGGASINTATGEITAPAYTFGGGTYTNVADALTALNNAAGSGNALGVVYDDQDKTQITLAGSTGTKITKVAAGDVNASSLDAMNGTQLYNVAASTADAIGGGSSFDPSTGKITNPTFNIGGATITNIAGAITNLDNRVYTNATDITNLQTQINEGGIGLVTQDSTSKNILVASQTDGSIVDFAGTKGARRLTGVAAGNVNASSFDAVNGTQLYNVAASTASVIGGGSTVKTDGTISNPTYIVGGSTVTTIGGAITNLDARVYANSTDITNLQTQINEGGIGLVTQNATSKNILVASQTDGSIVDFTGKDGARVLSGVAAGTGDNDAVNNAQLKAAGIINGDGSMKKAVTYNTVKDDSGKEVTDFSNITLGDGTPTSKPVGIHNVAAGEKDTDAVNYSQYADLVSKVNSISNAGTGVDTLFVGDGDRNTEQAKAGGTHATAMGALSVANGLQSVATGYASNATGSNAVAIGANSTASGNNSVALGAGSVASEDNTVSVGSASQQRRVTNVAAGTATTDAVNVGQLNDAITNASNNTVNQANSYTDSQFNKMNDKMNSLGAAAMAATSLIPNARAEGNFQMSAAAGTYGGAAAVAIGANYWVNDRVLVNAHVTRATGNGANTGASAGVTIGF